MADRKSPNPPHIHVRSRRPAEGKRVEEEGAETGEISGRERPTVASNSGQSHPTYGRTDFFAVALPIATWASPTAFWILPLTC